MIDAAKVKADISTLVKNQATYYLKENAQTLQDAVTKIKT